MITDEERFSSVVLPEPSSYTPVWIDILDTCFGFGLAAFMIAAVSAASGERRRMSSGG